MKKICVAGTGYVGLVTGACLAELGHDVVCLDIDASKIERLQAGEIPIHEPGLGELVWRNRDEGRLRFTTSYPEALASADFVFIAVATPAGQGDEADLRYVRAAARSIAECLSPDRFLTVINKSTVPIGTGDVVTSIIGQARPDARFAVVSNPEFLREGAAVHDFFHPDRIVLGTTDRWAAEGVAELYAPLNAPVIITDRRSAEMIKYASNAFLATKIAFINEIAALCERVGADVTVVAQGMGQDQRIGRAFLEAGLGYGGSCFPKDVKALAHMADVYGCHPQLLQAVMGINRHQRRLVVYRLRKTLGNLDGLRVAVLGLAFKPNTDDMRDSPAVEIIHLLQHEGATVRAHDPVAMASASRYLSTDVTLCQDPYECVAGADAVVVATAWTEFRQIDLARVRSLMRRPVLFDGRNLFEPALVRSLDFTYLAVGRGGEAEPMAVPAMLTGRAVVKSL
ncbi:MAG: UDP-glucose/GDP-mannose dehydrogenase family protein [Chloroflexi bacterium]|nr:UDP-glucose/GDP-mannose dehydrogenase family protein [Chloroflexota bacterium]